MPQNYGDKKLAEAIFKNNVNHQQLRYDICKIKNMKKQAYSRYTVIAPKKLGLDNCAQKYAQGCGKRSCKVSKK